MKTTKPTKLDAAMRAVRMFRQALVTSKEQLDQAYKTGTTEQRTELRSRIANLEAEVASRDAEIRRLMPDDPAVRARGMRLIEARRRKTNLERASRGLVSLDYEIRG